MKTYTEEDFMPADVPGQRYMCGCKDHGPMVVCKIKYVDEKDRQYTVCYRQQCQECGFVRKNRIGRILYYSFKDAREQYNFLPEYFWAPEEVTYDENMQYSREKKIDFLRRILTLANRDRDKKGHLEYTKEQIYSLDNYKKV